MEENLRHVQLPNDMTLFKGLKPNDALVYLNLKSFDKTGSRVVFPSLEILSKQSGASVPVIRKSLKNLEDKKYIKISKRGRGNQYYFEKYINYEPFSDEFIKELDIPFNIKAIYVVLQQFTFPSKIGQICYTKTSLPDDDLANKLNISRETFRKFLRYMEDNGYLIIVKSRNQIGDYVTTKIFNLTKLMLDVVIRVKKLEQKVNQNTDDIAELKIALKQSDERFRTLEEIVKGQSIQIEKLLEEKRESRTMIMN